MRSRSGRGNGVVTKARATRPVVSPEPAISHSAASVPSALVPDSRPMTTRRGRSRRASSRPSGSSVIARRRPRASSVLDGARLPVPCRRSPTIARSDPLCLTSSSFARAALTPGVVHDQRDLGAPARLLDQLARRHLVEAGQRAHDADRARPQLGVGRAHVDHQAAVGLAQQHERRGRDRVQRDLRGGAGLEARRAGDHLGAGVERDHHVGDALAVGRQAPAQVTKMVAGAAEAGVLERRADERGHARRGHAADDVGRPDRHAAHALLGRRARCPRRPRPNGSGRAGPPAMIGTSRDGGMPNVGTHSTASSVPSRPDVPAPT